MVIFGELLINRKDKYDKVHSLGIKKGTCVRVMVFNATFNNIEHNSPWAGFELTTVVVIGTDSTGNCKSNYDDPSNIAIINCRAHAIYFSCSDALSCITLLKSDTKVHFK